MNLQSNGTQFENVTLFQEVEENFIATFNDLSFWSNDQPKTTSVDTTTTMTTAVATEIAGDGQTL